MKQHHSGHTYQAFELCYPPTRQEIQKSATEYAREVVPGYGTLYCRNISTVVSCTVPGHRHQYARQSRKDRREETLRFSYRGTGTCSSEEEQNLADFLLGNTSRFLVISVDSYGMARNFQLSRPVPENQIEQGNLSRWLRGHGISGSPKTIWLREQNNYQNQNGERYQPEPQILLRWYRKEEPPVCLNKFGTERPVLSEVRKTLNYMVSGLGKAGNSPIWDRGHFSLEQVSTDSHHLIFYEPDGTPKQILDFSTGQLTRPPESDPAFTIREIQRYYRTHDRWVQPDTRPSAREKRKKAKQSENPEKGDDSMRHNPPILPKDYESIRNRKIQFSNTDHPVSISETVRPIKEEIFSQAMETIYPQEKAKEKDTKKEQSR